MNFKNEEDGETRSRTSCFIIASWKLFLLVSDKIIHSSNIRIWIKC